MNPALQPFVAVALPIMVTLVLAMWTNNRRLAEFNARLTDIRSDMHRRFDETTTRLDRIERKLDRPASAHP
jgi:hypothetical protein